MRLPIAFLLLATTVESSVTPKTQSTNPSPYFLRGPKQHRHLIQCYDYHICLHKDGNAKCIAFDKDSYSGTSPNMEYDLFVDRCDFSDDHQDFVLSGGYVRTRSNDCRNCCVGLESGQSKDDWGNDFRYLSLHQNCTSGDAGWVYDGNRPCFTKSDSTFTKCLHWGGYNVGIQECKTDYDLHQCWQPGNRVV